MAVFAGSIRRKHEHQQRLQQLLDTRTRMVMMLDDDYNDTTSFGLMYVVLRNSSVYMKSRNILTENDPNNMDRIKINIDQYLCNHINKIDIVNNECLSEYRVLFEKGALFGIETLVYYEVKNVNPELLNWTILKDMPSAKITFIVKDGILNKNITDDRIVGNYYKHLINEIGIYSDKINNKTKNQLKQICDEFGLSDQISWYTRKKTIYELILRHINETLRNDILLFYKAT